MAPAERRAPSRSLSSETTYALALGHRLRAVRAARGWSLQDVAGASHGQFNSSVIGSYERATRTISVPRLHTLADFYGVPVASLLPPDDEGAGEAGGQLDTSGKDVIVDLRAVEQAHEAEFRPFRRYIESIRIQRGGIGSRTLCVRAGDVSALAAASHVDPQVYVRQLSKHGLVVTRPTPDAGN
jgi:transcriptional regulator with XRE-family HTH domain